MRRTFSLWQVLAVRALTADSTASAGALKLSARGEGQETLVETTLPRLEIATILSLR